MSHVSSDFDKIMKVVLRWAIVLWLSAFISFILLNNLDDSLNAVITIISAAIFFNLTKKMWKKAGWINN